MYTNDPLASISLAGVEAREGVAVLPPGRHACVIKTMKVDTGPKDKRIVVGLEALNGSGSIQARLNLWASNAEALRISREQLKALAVYCGHPNPDNPFLAGVDPFINAQVGVTVATGKPYKDKDGKDRVSNEVKGFYKLEATPLISGGVPSQTAMSDDIPFAPCM